MPVKTVIDLLHENPNDFIGIVYAVRISLAIAANVERIKLLVLSPQSEAASGAGLVWSNPVSHHNTIVIDSR